MKKFNFAIIGCGGIARIHANAIKCIEDAAVTAVFDQNSERSLAFAKELSCKSYLDLDELLADKAIDAVSVCTPSGLHASIATKAAMAGKHIVLEKPMAITGEELSELKDAVKHSGVKLEVISQLRFTPSVMALKAAIDNGSLGRILHADYVMKYKRTQEYYDNGGWRGTWALDGGGALMNQGIHGIDLIQYLVGGIKALYADCRTLDRRIETEDTANILAEYNCGAVGVIQCTTCCEPGYPRRITISGTRGTVILKEDEIEAWDAEGSPADIVGGGVNAAANPLDISYEYHRIQIEDLVLAVKENREPRVNIDEGEKAVKIILSAYESSKTGKKITI